MRISRPDQQRAGRGGERTSKSAAYNLADSDDGLTLSRQTLNRLDKNQLSRLRTGDRRASRDDRRATPNPMHLSLVASGKGSRLERRPVAERDPAAGVLRGEQPQKVGGRMGERYYEVESGLLYGVARAGESKRRVAAGVSSGKAGMGFRRSARVTLARPSVVQARAAVPAPRRGRPQDTVDSAQEIARRVRSLVHASTAGGPLGPGVGGELGGVARGSGGPQGEQSLSQASGDGSGPRRYPGQDPGVVLYFRDLERKIGPYWQDAFPKWAIAKGRGGLAILRLTLDVRGRLVGVSVQRASGDPGVRPQSSASRSRSFAIWPLASGAAARAVGCQHELRRYQSSRREGISVILPKSPDDLDLFHEALHSAAPSRSSSAG